MFEQRKFNCKSILRLFFFCVCSRCATFCLIYFSFSFVRSRVCFWFGVDFGLVCATQLLTYQLLCILLHECALYFEFERREKSCVLFFFSLSNGIT